MAEMAEMAEMAVVASIAPVYSILFPTWSGDQARDHRYAGLHSHAAIKASVALV
jgi:hypothetical protein